MKQVPMAVSVSIFLLTLAVPSNSQNSEDTRKESFAPVVQTPAQVSTAGSAQGERQLSAEEMGDLYMARKQYHEAAVTYKQLADQNPKNAVYFNKLGIACHQQADLGLALKYYQRSAKVDPTYADALNNIGTVWYQRKRYSKAIKAYEKAIKIREDMAVLYSNLGYAYFGDKKYEEAIAAFRIALAKDPQFFEHNGSRTGSLLQDRSVSDRGRFYFLLAKSYAESNNLERCILYLRKAKDEGYASLVADVKKDQAFSAVLKDPAVQELLTPKPVDTAQP
jgi:tetratricopeptide (TPR) repeat protein